MDFDFDNEDHDGETSNHWDLAFMYFWEAIAAGISALSFIW